MQIVRTATAVAAQSLLAFLLLCWLTVGHSIVMAAPNEYGFSDFFLSVQEAVTNAKFMTLAVIYGFVVFAIKTLFGQVQSFSQQRKREEALMQKCRELICAGKRIDAIREYRNATGCGLEPAQRALGLR